MLTRYISGYKETEEMGGIMSASTPRRLLVTRLGIEARVQLIRKNQTDESKSYD